MAKKLSDIEKLVESSAPHFLYYLKNCIENEVYENLLTISKATDTYIFSGAIRNFFLRINEIRDLDIVLGKEIEIEKLLKKYKFQKNSFDGYKILIGKTNVDLWFLEKTWAFQHSQKTLKLELEKKIPDTAFFNFSAIVYSMTEEKFNYSVHFLRFLRDKAIDVVYRPNANYSLCVVNTFYYSDKYKLKIANNLKNYIKELHNNGNKNYLSVQIKHFGKTLYSDEDIERKIRML